jgi:hypothetical protein
MTTDKTMAPAEALRAALEGELELQRVGEGPGPAWAPGPHPVHAVFLRGRPIGTVRVREVPGGGEAIDLLIGGDSPVDGPKLDPRDSAPFLPLHPTLRAGVGERFGSAESTLDRLRALIALQPLLVLAQDDAAFLSALVDADGAEAAVTLKLSTDGRSVTATVVRQHHLELPVEEPKAPAPEPSSACTLLHDIQAARALLRDLDYPEHFTPTNASDGSLVFSAGGLELGTLQYGTYGGADWRLLLHRPDEDSLLPHEQPAENFRGRQMRDISSWCQRTALLAIARRLTTGQGGNRHSASFAGDDYRLRLHPAGEAVAVHYEEDEAGLSAYSVEAGLSGDWAREAPGPIRVRR